MTSAVTLAQLAAANSPVGFRNKLINGSFDLWQRGTSFNNLSNVYTADRWKIGYQDDGAIYTQQTSDLAGFNLYMRMIKGGVPNGSHMVQQAIETTNCADLIGQRVVFSCWARLSNSTTQATHQLNMALGFSATTDYSGWLNSADICSFYATWRATGANGVTFQAGSTGANSFAPSQSSGTLTTTWQRYFYTLIVPTNTRTVVCGVYSESTVQNGGIDVAGLQMEIGSVPTAFDRRHIAQEIILCDRYYQKTYSVNTVPGTSQGDFQGMVGRTGLSGVTSTGEIFLSTLFKSKMRATPSVIVYDRAGTAGRVTGTSYLIADYNNFNVSYRHVNDTGFGISSSGNPNAISGISYHYVADAEI
jgi:hypothetical protein